MCDISQSSDCDLAQAPNHPQLHKKGNFRTAKVMDITMKYINTFSKDIPVSQVALGCMRIASMTAQECEAYINHALDCGINYFDHADIYGRGNSEKLFGAYLKRNKCARDKMFIQTKCAIHDGQYDFSKEHVISSVEGSLSRLGIDYVDMLLLHRPDTLMEPEEVAEAFDIFAVRFIDAQHNILCRAEYVYQLEVLMDHADTMVESILRG